jgi:hypothetical protein
MEHGPIVPTLPLLDAAFQVGKQEVGLLAGNGHAGMLSPAHSGWESGKTLMGAPTGLTRFAGGKRYRPAPKCGMPNCTVRYAVRLVPMVPDAAAMNAIGIFTEVRMPNALGEPGYLVSRQLSGFSGSAGSSVKAMVTHGTAWQMDVQERIGPLEWDE